MLASFIMTFKFPILFEVSVFSLAIDQELTKDTKAVETKSDVLLIDTAGRLQTQTDLMEQLKKIHRVINKKNEFAPHHRILIVDATAGQNVLNQIIAFRETIDINGII